MEREQIEQIKKSQAATREHLDAMWAVLGELEQMVRPARARRDHLRVIEGGKSPAKCPLPDKFAQ